MKVKNNLAGKKGFTLLEILVVLAIFGLLLGVGITQVDKIFGDSQEKIVEMFVNESVKVPLMAYRMDMGGYPSTDEGLMALIAPPANRASRWKGPYIEGTRGKVPEDPWGNPYQYRFPGERNPGGYDIFSFGPDGVSSERDIGNW